MLVPYYRLNALAKDAGQPVDRLPIKTITVGPSDRKMLNVESVKMLLRQSGYTDVEVKASDTPYRG